MGSIVTGVASLFGGRKRRQEQAAATQNLATKERAQDAFQFSNVYEGLQGPQYGGYDAAMAQAGQLGPAAQAQLGQLSAAQGYDAQGYDAQGYTAQGTNVSGLARGAATGLTNTMANLQVSTAGAELAAQEADQSLAATQDLATQAGTGAGGATALAAAAARSKAGIAASIDQQVKANEQLRAQGQSELQRAQLAQGNLASQFDLGQQQFNVTAQNQAAQFGASAANQAAQFGAGSANEAARFGAQSQNQFSLAEFDAANRMNQFNVGTQNQFAMSNVDAQNKFGLANINAQNQALQYGAQMQNEAAQAAFNLEQTKREFDFRNQALELQKLETQTDRALAEKQRTDQARAQAKSDLIGGIGGVLSAAAPGIGGLIGGKVGEIISSMGGK